MYARESPSTLRSSRSCEEVNEDSDDPKDLVTLSQNEVKTARERRLLTDFYRNKDDHDLLKAFRMSTRHRLFQEL